MDQEEELTDYYFIMRKNIWLIIVLFFVIFGAVITYTFLSSPVYEARSLVVVTSQDQASYLLGQPTIRVDIETQMEIIKSASVLGRVADEIGEEFEIKVEAIKGSNVIEIIAQSTNRMKAQQAANSLAESYVAYTLEAKKEEVLNVIELISIQIEEYEQELDQLNQIMLEMKNEIDFAEAYADYVPEANLSDKITKELALQALEQQINAKDKLYNYLLSRREEVGIMAEEEGGNVKIIEYAEMPLFPVKPNILMNLALGIILALIGSVGIAFLKEYVRNTYKNIKEIENEYGQIVIGTIPKVANVRKGLLEHKKYNAREAIRMLKTNLMFYVKDKKIKLITVTSPQQGDGKSTIAHNLAMSLVKHKAKVLLVDASIRDPKLEQFFMPQKSFTRQMTTFFKELFAKKEPVKATFYGKREYKVGLTDVILEEVDLEGAIHHRNGLYVLYAGALNNNPSELIDSNRMKHIIKELRESRFDVVLFDCPSLEYSESLLLAADSDGVLLVIGHDKTKKDLSVNAKKALEKVKAKVIGIVVNFLR